MLAAYLDSTNLKPDARSEDIKMLCEEAASYEMAVVCVNPAYIYEARRWLEGSRVKICTVIGFPLGAGFSAIKVQEARQALQAGANELDMVINIGAVKDRRYSLVKNEIGGLIELRHDFPFLLKIIVETALLDEDELARMTVLISESGADFIKTSTGLAARGANLRDLEIINKNRGPELKIKASGGIRDLDWAMQLIDAGANRVGTSNAGPIMKEYRSRAIQKDVL